MVWLFLLKYKSSICISAVVEAVCYSVPIAQYKRVDQ